MNKVACPLVVVILALLLSSCAGGPAARIQLDYDGRPIAETTAIDPRFSFVDNSSRISISPDMRYENGTLLLNELPSGQYVITVEVDANEENDISFPGDLFYQALINVDRCEKCDLSTFHYDMMRIIHLTAPGDNSEPVHIWDTGCGLEYTPVTSPVIVSWEPVAEEADYQYVVYRQNLGPERSWIMEINGQTRATSITLDLKPTTENEFYSITMTAYRAGRPVGVLLSRGLCFYIVGFQFAVGGGGHK